MDIQKKIKYHQDVYAKLLDIYIRKNADYGDSFVKVRKKFAIAILVRLNDKMNRLESLFESKEQLVIDESIDDTFCDIANYCIMELMQRRIDAEFITENLKESTETLSSPIQNYIDFTKQNECDFYKNVAECYNREFS